VRARRGVPRGLSIGPGRVPPGRGRRTDPPLARGNLRVVAELPDAARFAAAGGA
jgi:hypothetical protein